MKHIIKEVLLQEAKKKKKSDDRCTRIAKRKYDVWPSAYASGAVVKCRQGKIWKNENLEYDFYSLVENREYEDSLKDIPQIGDTYKNVTVKTQNGEVKRNVKVWSVYPEKREVLVRTDAGGDAVVSFDDLLNEEPQELFAEKWSKDYKKSIDCNNPKGFSQKAHCAARKKRAKGEETKSKSPFKEEFILDEAPKRDFSKEKEKGLHGWFARRGGKGKSKGWVDCNTCRDGKCKSCGRQEGESRSKYPRCRPTPSQCKGYKRPDQR